MDYDVEIRLLSQKFADDYPEKSFPELMLKHGRPYTCLLIDTHEDYFICVPFRSSITHNTAFLFKNTQRSKRSRSGLDYTKMALIKNLDYIDNTAAMSIMTSMLRPSKIWKGLLWMSANTFLTTASI